ncbi:MAG: hypothetical protein [Caudoviricetes sp.]|nr:MAG: hypothetical protein [Caudoviricetes sp.]
MQQITRDGLGDQSRLQILISRVRSLGLRAKKEKRDRFDSCTVESGAIRRLVFLMSSLLPTSGWGGSLTLSDWALVNPPDYFIPYNCPRRGGLAVNQVVQCSNHWYGANSFRIG